MDSIWDRLKRNVTLVIDVEESAARDIVMEAAARGRELEARCNAKYFESQQHRIAKLEAEKEHWRELYEAQTAVAATYLKDCDRLRAALECAPNPNTDGLQVLGPAFSRWALEKYPGWYDGPRAEALNNEGRDDG